MGLYLRKSIKVGPVRFNLSKSGIGASVGVTGFRVGVRPNGKSYVHAGRYGVYYREELGKKSSSNNDYTPQNNDTIKTTHSDTVKYNSASSQTLKSDSRKELLERLNKSYKAVRLDLLCGILYLIMVLVLAIDHKVLSIVFLVIGLVNTIAVSIWENRRRTISIEYDFENDDASNFMKIIDAFNHLATNSHIWAMIESRNLYDAHESKLNSGASSVVDRTDAQVGEGKPPWVKTNIDVPVLRAREQSLYMMPDGILVYDNTGVGFVEYAKITVQADTTRFIEERPSSDASIIDYTWKYPNKKGGPDKRFKDNYEIPVCLYGELRITSSTGLNLYLMSSKEDSSSKFFYDFCNVL